MKKLAVLLILGGVALPALGLEPFGDAVVRCMADAGAYKESPDFNEVMRACEQKVELSRRENSPQNTARIGFSSAADVDPEVQATYSRIAQQTGVPVDTVFAMPDEMKKQARMGEINFDTLAITAPATAALLANVDKAKIAHDDAKVKPTSESQYLEKALATFFSSAVLIAIFATIRFKPWRLRPSNLSANARVATASIIVWVVAIQLWGFIWHWDDFFNSAEFLVLHISLPLLGMVAMVGYRWSKRT